MLERLDRLIGVSSDAGVAGLLERSMPPPRGVPEHYRATDLCNPVQAFYERTGHDPPRSPLLQRRLRYGTIMHYRFGAGVRGMDGFQSEEAYLDGALVDVPGITGKIDHRYEDSIVELKTSPYRVETPDDVWEQMPQNVAQLLIYAALWPKQSQEHFLVVLPVEERDDRPVHHPIRVFKIRIQDVPLLRRATAELLHRTKDAVAKQDPSDLGRCAYWDNECPFQQHNICACDGKNSRLKEWLGRGVVITRENSLEGEWERALSGESARGLTPYELAAPRRYYAAIKEGHDHFDGVILPAKADARQKVREAALRGTIAATADDLGGLEWPDEPAPRLGVVWLVLPKTRGLESKTRLVPAVVKEWTKPDPPTPKAVMWQARQAAAVAAYHGLPEAMVIRLDSRDRVFAFRVSLRQPGEARRLVVTAVQALRIAIDRADPSALDFCPDFTRKDCKVPGCACPNPAAPVAPAQRRTKRVG